MTRVGKGVTEQTMSLQLLSRIDCSVDGGWEYTILANNGKEQRCVV